MCLQLAGIKQKNMMISYAQNFEDVMLWRALQHVGKGFYIDIGAAWPDRESVTRHFYQQGWRGINVEPNPFFFEQLTRNRDEDINVAAVVSDVSGETIFYVIEKTGLSTADKMTAEFHQREGRRVDQIKAERVTLCDIWSAYVRSSDVHFLKIDVEGHEAEVVRGNDWSINRPWIVVVEATVPLSQKQSYEEWEEVLLTADYRFAYLDGLNRFYVASERCDLLRFFSTPPNVFDNFIVADSKILEFEKKAKSAEERALVAIERATEAERQAAVLITSKSWRMTAPLRTMVASLRSIRRKAFYVKNIQKHSHPSFSAVVYKIFLSSRMKTVALNILARFPLLRPFIFKIYQEMSKRANQNAVKSGQVAFVNNLERRIYNTICRIGRSGKE